MGGTFVIALGPSGQGTELKVTIPLKKMRKGESNEHGAKDSHYAG